jgi:hypothetical protein
MTSFRQSNQSNRTSTQALQKTSKTRRNMGLALASLLFVGAGIFLSQQAHAQNYLTRPVKIIVPFATGGPADNYARFMAQRLQDSLGKLLWSTTSLAQALSLAPTWRPKLLPMVTPCCSCRTRNP